MKSADDFKSAISAVRELMSAANQEYLIYSHRTHNQLLVKPHPRIDGDARPVVFQIAYDQVLLMSRVELLKMHGFEVVSVLGNEAAKAALLASPRHYSLFIIGSAGASQVRTEMAAWLKSHYPKIPILAINPPFQQQLASADYNITLNGPEEWLFIVQAAAA